MESLKNQLKALDGAIILLRNDRYDESRYVDAHPSKKARVTKCFKTDLIDAEWCKFILRHVTDNIVCFESVRFPNHYLDMHTEKTNGDRHEVRLTKFTQTPKKQPWARFSIVGNNLSKIGIRSERWTNRWLDAHPSGKLLGAKHSYDKQMSEIWGQFKLMFSSDIKEEWKVIETIFNQDSKSLEFTYSYTFGASRTTTKEYTKNIQVEVKQNFRLSGTKIGAKYSKEWKETNASTFEEITTRTLKKNIPPYYRGIFHQLVGSYGDVKIEGPVKYSSEYLGDGLDKLGDETLKKLLPEFKIKKLKQILEESGTFLVNKIIKNLELSQLAELTESLRKSQDYNALSKVLQAVENMSTLINETKRKFGKIAEITSNGNNISANLWKTLWINHYQSAFAFKVDNQSFMFGQTNKSGNFWFTRKFNSDGTLGSTTDKGNFKQFYKTAFPFKVSDKTYMFAHAEKDNYWFIKELKANGDLGKTTQEGRSKRNYSTVCSFTIGDKTYLYAHHDKTTNDIATNKEDLFNDGIGGELPDKNKNYWFIRELTKDGTLGKRIDTGSFLNFYPTVLTFISGNKTYILGHTNSYKFWFIRELTSTGLGKETARGNWKYFYPIAFPVKMRSKNYLFRHTSEDNSWSLYELTPKGATARKNSGNFELFFDTMFPFQIGDKDYFFAQSSE